VEKLTCWLWPFTVADGPTNMATDEFLLLAAERGSPTLRFYGWSEPTLSLGYFQSEKIRHADPLLAGLPCVRRPSGGSALVHHHEVTYALGLPASWLTGPSWACQMHLIIRAALLTLGVDARLSGCNGPGGFEGSLCFHHFTAGDVLVGSAKVAGSSQRKRRGAMVQHGGILLAQSPHTPSLPGIKELTGRQLTPAQVCAEVTTQFAATTEARLVDFAIRDLDRRCIAAMASQKYALPSWTCKR
jgi:lipoyl(octanoyl) transferase